MEIRRQFTRVLKERLLERKPLLQVVLGPRQVGKTTGVEQVFRSWRGPKLMVTADSPLPPGPVWISQNWQKADMLGENVLLVFDEIQKVQGWSEVVKTHFDADRKKGKVKVVLLGSASLNVARGLSESLAGRFELIRVHHWTPSECQKAFRWDLEEYLKFGGYPGPAPFVDQPDRWQDYLKFSIIEPVLNRDIQGLAEMRKPALFRQTFELALRYPAQEVSFQKILGQLQESGNATTVKHYLELLEGAFLLKLLYKYSSRPISTSTSSPKIVPLCPALIHALTGPEKLSRDSEWEGRVFEAAIGAHLCRSRGTLHYWRDGKHEVDFVLTLDEKLYAIEVKSGRRRLSRGLEVFSVKFKKAVPVILDSSSGRRFLCTDDVDGFIRKA